MSDMPLPNQEQKPFPTRLFAALMTLALAVSTVWLLYVLTQNPQPSLAEPILLFGVSLAATVSAFVGLYRDREEQRLIADFLREHPGFLENTESDEVIDIALETEEGVDSARLKVFAKLAAAALVSVGRYEEPSGVKNR